MRILEWEQHGKAQRRLMCNCGRIIALKPGSVCPRCGATYNEAPIGSSEPAAKKSRSRKKVSAPAPAPRKKQSLSDKGDAKRNRKKAAAAQGIVSGVND